jgi:CRISPR system Cascade subunit CasD
MSFGAPIVDNYGRTEHFMSLSALTGLLANALGYSHGEAHKLQALQARLSFAQRCDRPGQLLRDYQTVDLGQDFMLSANAWTTWGRLDERQGGPDAQKGTHIRYRDYIADSIYTLAVGLTDDQEPGLDALSLALQAPERPLFIGRKACLPAAPLYQGRVSAESALGALQQLPRLLPARSGIDVNKGLSAWWSAQQGVGETSKYRELRYTDQRDWANQIHSGQRRLHQGLIFPPERQQEVSHG